MNLSSFSNSKSQILISSLYIKSARESIATFLQDGKLPVKIFVILIVGVMQVFSDS